MLSYIVYSVFVILIFSGEIGILLDSVAVVTDYKQKKLPWLTLSQIFNLIAALKANGMPYLSCDLLVLMFDVSHIRLLAYYITSDYMWFGSYIRGI